MALTSDITLNNGTTTTVMSEISRTGTETLRRAGSRGLVFPKTLRIAHQVVNAQVGGKANRAMVRIDDVQNTDVSDPSAKAGEAVYFVMQKPEKLPDPANIQKMVTELKTFLTPENVTKLLNGES